MKKRERERATDLATYISPLPLRPLPSSASRPASTPSAGSLIKLENMNGPPRAALGFRHFLKKRCQGRGGCPAAAPARRGEPGKSSGPGVVLVPPVRPPARPPERTPARTPPATPRWRRHQQRQAASLRRGSLAIHFQRDVSFPSPANNPSIGDTRAGRGKVTARQPPRSLARLYTFPVALSHCGSPSLATRRTPPLTALFLYRITASFRHHKHRVGPQGLHTRRRQGTPPPRRHGGTAGGAQRHRGTASPPAPRTTRRRTRRAPY